jgi:hypothetical protein
MCHLNHIFILLIRDKLGQSLSTLEEGLLLSALILGNTARLEGIQTLTVLDGHLV